MIPNEHKEAFLRILNEIWNDTRYQLARENCHNIGHPAAHDFAVLVLRRAKKEVSGRFGCNGRRGSNNLSYDALAYKLGSDTQNVVVDFIASAGSKNAHPTWIVDNSGAANRYFDPDTVPTHFEYPGVNNPTPVPNPQPGPEPVENSQVLKKLDELIKVFDWESGALFRHTAEVCTKLDILTEEIRNK